jgi:hypothetical protein
MSPPWSSALARSLQRDREQFLVAFLELRAVLLGSPPTDFAGGEVERAHALVETGHDYIAIVAAGAEAANLEATLAAADREATQRELDSADLVIHQMRELVDAVAERLPTDS